MATLVISSKEIPCKKALETSQDSMSHELRAAMLTRSFCDSRVAVELCFESTDLCGSRNPRTHSRDLILRSQLPSLSRVVLFHFRTHVQEMGL